MKNRYIFVSIIVIIFIDIFIGKYIFTRNLDYSITVTCWITLLSGSIGGLGTLIAVGLSNSVSRKQLELSIIYTLIEDIKKLIEKIANINNEVIGLKHLNLSNKKDVEQSCNKLLNSIENIKVNTLSVRNEKLKKEIISYFDILNSKVCNLKYSNKENLDYLNTIVQEEMLNIQKKGENLKVELKRLYLEIDNL